MSVRKDCAFVSDPKLEAVFLELLKEFDPRIIHLQLFSGVNALSILRASARSSVKKIITLHDHSLFCPRGTCFDKERACTLNSMEECSCATCRSAARHEKLSLSKYGRARKGRSREIVSLADVIICCSHWQKAIVSRLLGDEGKAVVLYYGVRRPSRYKYMATVTKLQIEKAGIDWSNFIEKVIRNGWGRRINTTTIRFAKLTDDEKDRIPDVLGRDYSKLLSVVRRHCKNVPKMSSLPCFGYLGSLAALKGVDVLLDAVQKLGHLRFQIVMGILCGPGQARDIVQLRKLNGQFTMRVMTNLNTTELDEKFFSQIDYLIIPSLWEETGPMTLFEAFLYKTPVIISNHPSLIEKTREGVNSLVFDNADTLAQIMKDIITGRLALKAEHRANFPVKTDIQYTALLNRIYVGQSEFGKGNS